MLVTVSGAVRSPGVFEVALGTPLATPASHARADSPSRPQALLLGGYFGTWVAAADAASLTPQRSSTSRRVGARLGAGAIVVLPASACGVAETARVARYLAGESAGQCGPCLHGLAAVADSLEAAGARRSARRPHGRGSAASSRRCLGQVEGRGACRHPDGAVRFVRSALAVFAGEVEQHLDGPLRAATAA